MNLSLILLRQQVLLRPSASSVASYDPGPGALSKSSSSSSLNLVAAVLKPEFIAFLETVALVLLGILLGTNESDKR
jgi:hypothetical protein